MRCRLARKPRVVQQPGIEGRHTHHGSGVRQAGQHLIQLETRQELHCATGQHAGIGRHEQAVGVEDRQGMQQDIRAGKLPEVPERQRVTEQIAVRQHRALGSPGGTRRVENGTQIVS